jgi:hypothetical protein
MALRMGPTERDGLTLEDLRIGREVHGERVMEEGRIHGTRPWGWWRFVAGEEEAWPDEDDLQTDHCALSAVRLAELGELTGEELAAIEEDANVARPRIGTPAEHISGGGRNTPGAVSMDQQDVDLWEAVQAALKRGRL